jgi:ADP-heptose:LPS heptosyltransferase
MRKILVLRLSAIGDVAMTVHALRSLSRKYPDLEITLGTRERLAGFFKEIPNVDFLFFPDKAGLKELYEYIKTAGRKRFDYVADLQNNLRTSIIRTSLRMTGSKVAAYEQMAYGKWKVRRSWPWKKDITPLRNNVLRFCDVFGKLGFPVPDPVLVHKVLPLPDGFGPKEGVWIGIAPFSRREKKIYPLDSCAELIRLLSLRCGKVFIFSGPGAEVKFCNGMKAMYPNIETVFGRTDLAGETALISNLDALVTMDSATMHMATLTGAPYLAIWGGTHPATGYSAYGANWEKNYLQLDMACRPCSSYGEGGCRYGDFHCLGLISPDMVVDKLEELTGLALKEK